MIKRGTRGKQMTALLLSAALLMGNIPFMDWKMVFAATGQDPSWGQEALELAAVKKYIPTGLSYRTSTSGIKPEYGFMGEKQYLHGSGKYADFANRYIYCINLHKDNGEKILYDTQAFHSDTYNLNKLPTEIIKGVSEEQKKFNFLMMVYATSYRAKQKPNTLDPPKASVGVDVITICSQITQEAADSARYTGDWNTDFSYFKSVNYQLALAAVGPTNTLGDSTTYRQLTSTDIPQWAKDRGCTNYAQAMFCYIWTAAKISSHVELNNGKDVWSFEAKLEEDGLYHIRIPFDGENQYIIEYLRIIQAECHGDWQKREDTACLHFVSPTGQMPSEGSIAKLTYVDSEGMIAKNFSEAELFEFKFYADGKQGPGFDNVQSYFAAIMDQDLEIYLVTGGSFGGSTEIEINRYEHEESWKADYNVNLIKYDSETGKPLEGAHFDILESFNGSQLEDTGLDLMDADGFEVSIGSLNATDWGDDTIESNYDGDTGLLQTDALLYNWANDGGSQFEQWEDPKDDPCIDDDDITDPNGWLTYRNGTGESTGKKAHSDIYDYIYHKGYCDGHPAPVIQYEEPEENEDGEGGKDVDAYNQQLHDEAWAAWYAEVETCAALASEGGFFHAIDPELAREAMEADRDQFYEDFISLTYDYSARELESRKGYLLHGLHGEDVEIEWRTVTSSQYKDFMQNGISHRQGSGDKDSSLLHSEPLIDREGEAIVASEKPESQLQFRMETEGEASVQSSFLFIDEDSSYTSASPSEAEERAYPKGSPSEAEEATPSEAAIPATPSEVIRKQIFFTGLMADRFGTGRTGSGFFSLFASRRSGGTRDLVSFEASQASVITPGTDTTIDWTFILYDHRTEGEVHINKQDLDLNQAKSEMYESYGDTQGDSTLEGAVYGLFAASDVVHPDGKTGVVFQKDNLVAIATTDKNGNASFLAITEAPGTRFSFEAGSLEKTGFTGPENLYTSQTEADSIQDNEQFEGHSSNGGSLSLKDSTAGDGTWYQKQTSNQGADGTGDSNAGYPIQNNAANNGNVWIGRPLIVNQEGSRYYIMELSRSEGYELSRYGVDADVSNREADAAGVLPSAEGTVEVSELEMNRKGGYNQFSVAAKDTRNGYDLVVTGLSDGASFYTTKTETAVNPNGTHTELVPVKDPVYGTPGSQVILEGKAVEASVGAVVALPNGGSATVKRISEPPKLWIGVHPGNAFQIEPPVISGENRTAVKEEFINKVNENLKKAGYKIPEKASPWLRVKLSGTTEKAWCESITDCLKKGRVFNAFFLEDVIQEKGSTYALLHCTYLQAGTSLPALYDEVGKSIWVRKNMTYQIDAETVEGYQYYEYPAGTYEITQENTAGFVTAATVKQQSPVRSFAVWGEDLSEITLRDETGKQYWVYAEKEQAYDNKGNPVYSTRYESQEIAPGYEEKTTDTLLDGLYDMDSQTYTVHITPELIPADGKLDFRIKYEEEFAEGTNISYPDYVRQNAIVSAFPSMTYQGTYIENVLLTYPGQAQIYQDDGTREHPILVLERIIRQKIKIIKDIRTTPEGTYTYNTNAEAGHTDSFTTGLGGTEEAAAKLQNFRFKLYLKSNLERLYRDESGEIHWLDRDGTEVETAAYQAAYPESEPFGSVQKLYTKVLHKQDSSTSGSRNNNVWEDAVTVNSSLYSYEADGLLSENQNPGYTRLLETTVWLTEDGTGKTRKVEKYNYEKFFDAIYTANHDKWDRAEDKSTSFKPFSFIRERIFGADGGEKNYPAVRDNRKVKNAANTSDIAKENAKRSDAVRQFAITWYLDDEVKKQMEDNGQGENQAQGADESYQNEIHDKALYAAVLKAENYLTPFFTYDLDEIYAVAWDGEEGGGTDKDRTTLSANTLYETAGSGLETSKEGYFYGISKYLPYGTYVTVEQQPWSAQLGDFYNKHYKTDQPKEILLPALYEEGGEEGTPGILHRGYQFDSTDTPEELQRKYHIRMNEEWPETNTGDLRSYVIRAHNNNGDFEIFKYGLDADRRTGSISYPGGSYTYQGFAVAQEDFDPYKDVYKKENPASGYRSNQKVGQYYHYGSFSERAKAADNILYQHGADTDDNNPSGFLFKDNVKTITGVLTGYDGQYFAALVPWTVTEPVDAGLYEPEQFTGYADGKYQNTFYTSKLRIEKLDSETGENILHDGAVFTLYSAEREDGEHTEGRVKFYEKDTVLSGSREFLEAMGADDIKPVARPALPWQIPYMGKYYGTVRAGTPVCRESERIVMADETGEKTGQFQAFTTTKDRGESGSQNTGYLETSQPLGAGCYVLCEIKAPAGYVRSKPVAIEIYSDAITYYLDGERDNRIVAAVYEEAAARTPENEEETRNPDGTKPNRGKREDTEDVARVYLNNTPIRLEVTKAKPDEEMAAYELNGRLEGSILELKGRYGLENLEFAYNASGTYLGYGWKKGFLDALRRKQEVGESIEIHYEDGVFTGKATLYKVLETADDENRYLPGAVMTLYDALEVKPNGDSEDYQYDGVRVERDRYGNVTNIFVQKGFAGTQLKFVLDKTNPDSDGLIDFENYTYDDQEDDKGEGTWIYKTVERDDTDILFYDLGSLTVLQEEKGILYGFDREGKKVQAKNGSSLFVLQNGTPFLEICCPDYKRLKYSRKERVFEAVPEGTEIYHLDTDQNRDSRVHPYTGMAYVVEEATGKVLVWPVKTVKDQYDNVIAREKITTSRIAAIDSDTDNEFTVGTYQDGVFHKTMNPVLDEHGQPDYYQQSEETYQKGSPVYDRDGDYVRYRYDDKLKAYNDNAWRIDTNRDLQDIGSDPEQSFDDRPLYHRQGESYIIPNTWTTGEAAPDNPFQEAMTDGQVDVLKRVPAGLYIMEELKAPEGYVKTMPVGLTVEDKTEVQTAKATDRPISGYIEKLDAPESYRVKVIDMDQVLDGPESRIEGKTGYSYDSVSGARLALYRARRVSTSDLENHPSGYYLEKAGETPAQWTVLDEENQKKTFTAEWVVGDIPKYLEAIPKGYYILEELEAPAGFVQASTELEIRENEGLQYIVLPNDHTKLEIFKYIEEDGSKRAVMNDNPAEFALYEVNAASDILLDRWITDDCREYTSIIDTASYRTVGIRQKLQRIFNPAASERLSGFTYNYEKSFKEYGTSFDTLAWETERSAVRDSIADRVFRTTNGFRIIVDQDSLLFPEEMEESDRAGFIKSYSENEDALTVNWPVQRTAIRTASKSTEKNESVYQNWETDTGKQIVISAEKNLTQEGKGGYSFDYKFNYKKLNSNKYPHAVSYDTTQGNHRIDSIPCGQYRLTELKAPDGYERAEERILTVEETTDVQLYSVKNIPQCIYVEKLSEDKTGLLGAKLALYRSDDNGEFRQEEQYLEDTWTSGTEGFYTMEDFYEGKIPDGFLAGEMKPHKVKALPDGIYYLIEVEAPDGFERIKPQRIELAGHPADEDVIRVTAVDRIKRGRIRIEKTGSEAPNKKLAGAKFEVKNCITGEIFILATDENGHAEISGLITGRLLDGKWSPYIFTIRELVPPDKYALSPEVQTFCFTDSGNDEVLTFFYEAQNEPTEIVISKSDFYTGEFMNGARLAIYQAVEENGVFISKGTPLEEWISDGKRHRVTGKLTAGGIYFLEELEAPSGYLKTAPILFSLSDDGRKINSIRDQERLIEFTASGSYRDAVESISVQGRKAVRTEVVLTDIESERTLVIPFWQTRPLSEADGLAEGRLYEEKELTYYTDQSIRTTRSLIFRMHLNEKGEYKPKLRTVEKTILEAGTEREGVIEEWEVENREGMGYRHVIYNPEYEEKNGIEILGSNGKYGASVSPGSIVKYELTCKNMGKTEKKIHISVQPDAQTDFMPANSDKNWEAAKDGTLTMTLDKVDPGAEKKIILAVAVKEDAKKEILCRAGIDGSVYEWKNPIAGGGSLSIVNRLAGTAAEELEGKEFFYKIELLDKEGKPLTGSFRYIGDREGSIKNGDSLVLGSGESVTIMGIPWRTVYQIIPTEETGVKEETDRKGESGREAEKIIQGDWQRTEYGAQGRIGSEGTSAVFMYRKNDNSMREKFKKNDICHLTETILYSDGEEMITGKLTFTLDDSASAGGMDMKDLPVRVLFGKTDITGETELAGAHFSLENEEGEILDEWISDGSPHETKAVLEPGKSYFLIEVSPPEGYAAAEEIRFTVSEDGIPQMIRMGDRPTSVEISKTSAKTGKGLAGAELEIADEQGNRIDTWISDGTPRLIKGRLIAGKTYILRELSAPYGYQRAEPVTFTVSENGSDDIVRMEDQPTRIFIEKIGCESDGRTEIGRLEGAVIRIEDQKGREVYRFLSSETSAHEITGILGEGETYRAVEEEAPYGYEKAEPVLFTVLMGGEITKVRMIDIKKEEPPADKKEKDSKPEIILHKYDGVTLKALSGAEFSIYRSDGSLVTAVRTGENGRAVIQISEPGTYTAVETKAPEGYCLSEEEYTFKIPKGGSGKKEIRIPNYPSPEEAGLITVYYNRNLNGSGNILLKKRKIFPLPSTGDAGSKNAGVLLMLILFMASVVLTVRRRKKNRKENSGS